MIPFKEFLEERVRENYLYHNTAFYKLLEILKDNQLVSFAGRFGVSFTRNPRYNISPGTYGPAEVTFVFDREKLRQRRKIRAFADLSVASSSGWKDDETVQGPERRWESEERVQSPIELSRENGFIEFRVPQKYIDKHILIPIRVREEGIKDKIEQIDRLKKENVFWNKVLNKWMPVESDRQKKIHNVASYEASIERQKKEIKEYQRILNHPKLRII
jgi:hypothetical protein